MRLQPIHRPGTDPFRSGPGSNAIHFSFILLISMYVLPVIAQNSASFHWPEGKRAALSLSFDDARLSNVDVGTELFKNHDAKVTFYVVPDGMKPRLEQWKAAVKDGHEIGNHTLVHPCSGNFSWAREKGLENYNLAAMRRELLAANEQIEAMLGVTPVSFAYSCGQTFVGRGTETRSYVPLVAELFTSGRGWLDEAGNDPWYADLAQLQGIEMDGKDFEKDIKPILEESVKAGSWIVLAGHEIGQEGVQTTRVSMLDDLLAYVQNADNGIWLAPVGTVTDYVKEQRARNRKELGSSLTFCATFDEGYEADLARGDAAIYTADNYGELETSRPGMSNNNVRIAEGEGRFGNALHFQKKGDPVIFYRSEGNVAYDEKNWSGAVSLWLSLDPEKDLEPGYSDPIQITDAGYNDAAIWVDFSDKNPRSFRMGVYGDLSVWNPENIEPDENPAFNERLLPAEYRPFGSGIWTHVVVTFSNLNTERGIASFFINGRHQGDRKITEPFTWDLAGSKIFLGLNYVGLMDEVALFDRALTKEEVMRLYSMPGGIREILKERED